MPIQTPGKDELKEAIYDAFFTIVLEGLNEIKDDKIKNQAMVKQIENIEKLSIGLATAIDKYILNTIVIINAGIPVSIKTNPTTGKGKTVSTSTSSTVLVDVDLVNPTTGQGETTAVGTS
jgi:hypothetical protein